MSESMGKPWIESSVAEILVNHAHELPSPAQLQGRAQIVKFLTFREDTSDGRQPRDRDTVLWAEITDGQWIMPVRIANEVTNQIEDHERRALTYYRRGFFTLKAAVSYDFVPQQLPGGKTHMKMSTLKRLLLDIVELQYLSGGGPGAPVATRSATLQTPPTLEKWETWLRIGGQTLTGMQAKEKSDLEKARASKASSRRSNAINVGRRASKAPIKPPVQQVTPHPSVENLTAFCEWQDAFWGKRANYRDLNFAFGPKEFEVTPDQQVILDQLIERIGNATPSHPYDPTDTTNSSFAPGRHNDLPSFRASQVISSTPVDARLPHSSPTGSFFPEEDDPIQPSPYRTTDNLTNNERNPNSGRATPIQSQQALDRTTDWLDRSNIRLHSPTLWTDRAPHTGESRAKSSSEHSAGLDDTEAPLDADDAISEKILTVATSNTAVIESEFLGDQRQRYQPVILVPDSDPPSQRHAQVRHSSPWDCESVIPSGPRSYSHSPEAVRSSTAKGKRQFSPTLSSPPRPIAMNRNNSTNTQSADHANNSQKPTTGSAQGDSQESAAAASLPSPPPEVPSEHQIASQHSDHALNCRSPPITDEPAISTQTLRHGQDKDSQRDLSNIPNGQGESSSARPRTEQLVSKKRRLSQSQSEEPPTVVAQQKSLDNQRQLLENKRRRLDYPHVPSVPSKNPPRESNVRSLATTSDQDGLASDLGASSNTAESRIKHLDQSASQSIIPHDHEAWSNPSWMDPQVIGQSKEYAPPVLSKTATPALTAAVRSQDERQVRRVPKHGLRILRPRPPFQHAVQRAASPNYPPITPSQVADADEDAPLMPLPNSKFESLTPARSTDRQASTLPKSAKAVQPQSALSSRPTPKDSSSISAAEHSKSSRTSVKPAANGAGTTENDEAARPHDHSGASKIGEQNKSNQPLISRFPQPNAGRANEGSRLDNDADAVVSASKPIAQKQYLGGFRPSLSLDLDQAHAFTWEMWLKVVSEADVFWREGL